MIAQQNPLGAAADTAEQAVRAIAEFDWRTLLDLEVLSVKLIQIGVILLLAFVFWRVLKSFTARLARREVEEEDPIVKRLREQRAQTMAGLLNNVGVVGIAVITILLVLQVFLDDIGPLLATVGILGLAVSFGAQSLVKDVITGAFILMEGQYAIGDVIRVKETAGMVEKITLRTTVLRDLNGIVHVVPNGEITMVSNMTKQWSRAVLDIGVAYKEDVDRVMEVLADVAREMREDPEWGPLMIEDCEIAGVEAFGDSAVVIRMLVKTLPLKQWNVARQLRRRIKIRFDQDGIEIPFPHRTFYWGMDQMPPALRPGPAADGGADAEPARRGSEAADAPDALEEDVAMERR